MHTPALRQAACITIHFTLIMEIIVDIINPFRTIYNLYDKIKNNNELCPHILQRVKALEKLVRFILEKKPEQFSEDVNNALGKLNKVLLSAAKLIGKFNESYKLAQMVKSSDYKSEFDNLNKSLSDAFVTLSGALHVHQGKKLDEQENKLAEQKKKLVEQEKKVAEQEDILQRVESKLVYESRGYYCILQ